jgi:hypothetical protein
MKNQYVGDIHDYRKYGLLRALQSQSRCSILVAWMLTPDDGSEDGNFRSYVKGGDRWKTCDPELFTSLAVLHESAIRDVSVIERSSLIPNASYYSMPVPESRTDREIWQHGLLEAARNVDLVFLDPDNGIEVPSKPAGQKGSPKYVLWDEIKMLWTQGCSLLIYQHFCREQRQSFAKRLVAELRACTGAASIEAFHTSHALFLLIAQDRHAPQFQKAHSIIYERWNKQMWLTKNDVEMGMQ